MYFNKGGCIMGMSLNSMDDLLSRLQSKPMTPAENIFRTTFPQRISGYETREQQIQMARQIEDALTNNQHVLAEAGTGTGKSYAYLLPVALHLKENSGRAVISTGTIALQEQLMNKDIPFLEKTLGLSFDAQLAKGKSNYICAAKFAAEKEQTSIWEPKNSREGIISCLCDWVNENGCTGDRSDYKNSVPNEIWASVCVDDACTGKKCPARAAGRCFLYKARAKMQRAKVIVCNHALFFTDLKIRESSEGYASILPEYQIAVFDEAHHVEQIARNTLGTQVSNRRIPMLLSQLRKLPGCDQGAVQDALMANDEFFHTVVLRGDSVEKYTLDVDAQIEKLGNTLISAVDDVVDRFDDYYGENERTEKLHALLGNAVLDLGSILRGTKLDSVYWVEHRKTGKTKALNVKLHETPIDVAPFLSENLFNTDDVDSVIMTSATLSTGGSFSYLKKAVGCDDARELCVDSPFDYYNQCLLYLPKDLPDPKSQNFHSDVVPFIEEILLKTDGRAFVLFTSYRGMNEVYNQLADRLKYTVLKQGDLPKQQLLEQFKQDTNSVLFATASFWEGVDVQGESLSCVIIVKLPFAVPDDPITEAKIKAIERSGGNAFIEYSVPEAALKLKQGFGRLIRTKQDRGMVAILDPRIKTKGYGRKFLRALPECREIRSLENVDLFLKQGKQEKPAVQADFGSGKNVTVIVMKKEQPDE
jgi:ATP-dependent DNA helicase DinG